ncbi:hypothetical protein VTO42DRAFT_9073 [Malbranchea cinnamomea]
MIFQVASRLSSGQLWCQPNMEHREQNRPNGMRVTTARMAENHDTAYEVLIHRNQRSHSFLSSYLAGSAICHSTSSLQHGSKLLVVE